MTYYFYHEDVLYKEAFEKYYQKNKSHEISISFEETPRPGEIVICEKSSDKFPNHECLFLSNKNLLYKQEINKYQNMNQFYQKLIKNENLEVEETKQEIYVVSNGSGGSGATTLSLNLANLLSENHQVFYISLDILPRSEKLLIQNRSHGFSEIIYMLKTNSPLNCQASDSLEYFNSCDYIEDMMNFTPELLKELIKSLLSTKYDKIVVDIGQRYEFLSLEEYKFFLVLNTDFSDIDNKLTLKRLKIPDCYLINKKEEDEIIHTHHLNCLEAYEFVSKDFNLKKGGLNWSSKDIQKTWKKILNLKS